MLNRINTWVNDCHQWLSENHGISFMEGVLILLFLAAVVVTTAYDLMVNL